MSRLNLSEQAQAEWNQRARLEFQGLLEIWSKKFGLAPPGAISQAARLLVVAAVKLAPTRFAAYMLVQHAVDEAGMALAGEEVQVLRKIQGNGGPASSDDAGASA